MNEFNLPDSDDAPWLNLSKEEIEEYGRLFRRIVDIIAETDSDNNDKAVRIFLEFHSYLITNSPSYFDDEYSVDFNDILNVLETLDDKDT